MVVAVVQREEGGREGMGREETEGRGMAMKGVLEGEVGKGQAVQPADFAAGPSKGRIVRPSLME